MSITTISLLLVGFGISFLLALIWSDEVLKDPEPPKPVV